MRVPSEDTYAEPLPIPPSLVPRARSNSRWDPASPTALARLLSSLTPRESALPSPAPGASFDMDENFSSPTVGGSDDSELSSSPGLGLSGVGPVMAAAILAESVSMAQADAANQSHALAMALGSSAQQVEAGSVEDEEADLRATLEGVWKMWKKSRRAAAGPSDPSDDRVARDVFLRTALDVVKDA